MIRAASGQGEWSVHDAIRGANQARTEKCGTSCGGFDTRSQRFEKGEVSELSVVSGQLFVGESGGGVPVCDERGREAEFPPTDCGGLSGRLARQCQCYRVTSKRAESWEQGYHDVMSGVGIS
jgi:hypothetical protein